MESVDCNPSVPLRSPLKRPALLAALLGFGLLLRLGYSSRLPNDLLMPDAWSFDTIAWSVASEGRYVMEGRPTTYRPPSYVLFMAGIYKVAGHHYQAVRIAQAFLGIWLVLVLIKTAAELGWSAAAQWMTGVVAACYPFFIYYESHLISDSYLTFWHALALLSVLRWHHEPLSVSRAVLVGACFAALGLLKGIFLPLFGVVLIVEAFLFWPIRHSVWRSFLAATLACALPLCLWGLRNQKEIGRFSLDGHGSRTLIETIVFHDHVKDGTFPSFWTDHPLRVQTVSMNEAEREAFFADYVKRFIVANPALYLRQCVERFQDLWRFYPRQDRDYPEGRRWITILSILTEPLLILAGLAGLMKARGQWKEIYPFYATLFLTTLAHTLITGQMRYRLPMMPIVILFASYAFFSKENRSSDH